MDVLLDAWRQVEGRPKLKIVIRIDFLPLRTRLLAPQEAKKSLVYVFCLQVDAVFKRNDVDHDGRMSLHDFQAFMEHNQERKNSLKDSPHHRKHSSGSGGGGGGKHS